MDEESNEIPDLWRIPEINVDILTPKEILDAQASYFTQKTKGLLRAEVVNIKMDENGFCIYNLDVVAPTIGNLRFNILTLCFDENRPYPAKITYKKDIRANEKLSSIIDPLGIAARLQAMTPKVLLDEDVRYTEQDVIDEFSRALNSNMTKAAIQSLMVRIRQSKPSQESNAKTLPDDKTD
jgi:hypothetical protein